jgi:hypothetical protein
MSAIDQYCEAIPSAGGDRGNTDTDRGGLPLSAATLRALEKQGETGKAIIALSGAAAKQEQSGSKSGGSRPAAQPVPVQPDQPSANPFSALASGFGDTGDTVGPLFGTMLLLLALVFFATAWLRYRRRAQS